MPNSSDGHAASVVWLCGVSPGGVDSGLAMYTRGLTESVSAAGCAVHGVAMGALPSSSAVRWTTVASEPRSRGPSLLSFLPYIAARLATADHRDAVDGALVENPDIVVIDHLMSAWCLSRVLKWRRKHGGSVVHVSHNHETKVRSAWARSESLASPRGLYLRIDAVRIARLERKLMRSVDLLTTITLEDRRSMASNVEFARSIVIPPGWTDSDAEARSDGRPGLGDRGQRVVLLGSLDWQAKRDNVLTVVAALDEPFSAAGIELVVAGGGDDGFVAAQQGKWAASSFLGRVEDLDELLASCRVGLVAEPVGGGFKLKALDYGFSGLPIAVLAGSMAGLDLEPGRDVISGSTLEELCNNIVELIDDPVELERRAKRTQTKLSGRFEWLDRGRKLADRFSKMTSVEKAGLGGSAPVRAR